MNNKKLQDAVAKYELTRQQVAILTDQRAKLIILCTNEKIGISPPYESRDICLKVAMQDLGELLSEEFQGSTYNYKEVLEEKHEEGTCCQNCYDSYLIKTGPLAKAKRDHGYAKVSLSMLGKILMKKKPL